MGAGERVEHSERLPEVTRAYAFAAIDRIGTGSLQFFEDVGAIVVFGVRAVVEAVRPPYEPREVRHGTLAALEGSEEPVVHAFMQSQGGGGWRHQRVSARGWAPTCCSSRGRDPRGNEA